MKCNYPPTLPRRRRRHLPRFPRPPELEVEFPPYAQVWLGELPAVIKPWLDGTRAFWLPDERVFQLQTGEYVRVTGITPESPYTEPLEGVFWEKWTTPQEIRQMVLKDEPSPYLNFNIVDIAREEDAEIRALLCQEIPEQQDNHVITVMMFEVYSVDAFNMWLAQFQAMLFSGTLAVGRDEEWGAAEYTVTKPLSLFPPTA